MHVRAKQKVHSFITSRCQAEVQLLSVMQGPSKNMVAWEDKHHNRKHFPSFLLSLNFYGWTWHCTVWNIPLVSPGKVSQLWNLSSSWLLQPTHWGRGEKTLALCKHCSAIGKMSVCYQHCLKHKAQHHVGCYGESWLNARQTLLNMPESCWISE